MDSDLMLIYIHLFIHFNTNSFIQLLSQHLNVNRVPATENIARLLKIPALLELTF